jgi:hypothetical protein
VFEIGSHVLMSDDFCNRKHFEIAAGMVVVLMRVDHIPDGLAGDGLHLSQDIGMVPIKHVIDEDHTLGRNEHRDVSPLSGDQVQIVFDFGGAQWTGRFRILRVYGPCTHEEKHRGEKLNEQCATHAFEYGKLLNRDLLHVP